MLKLIEIKTIIMLSCKVLHVLHTSVTGNMTTE